MNYGFLKTALASPELRVADVPQNLAQITQLIQQANQHCADVILFPELALSGATCGDLFRSQTLLAACHNALQSLLHQTAGLPIICAVGLPLSLHGQVYNVCAVFQKGTLLAIVPKQPPAGLEQRFFAVPPATLSRVTLFGKEVPFGAVCFADANFPGVTLSVAFELPQASAELVLLCPWAHPERVGQAQYRRLAAAAWSALHSCAVVCADAPPGESSTDAVFSGHRLAVEGGDLLAESELFSTGLLYADLDTDRLLANRRTQPGVGSGETVPISLRSLDTPLDRRISATPFLPDSPQEISRRCEEILAIQVHALKKRLAHLLPCEGAQAVLGLSGGLDSTLALCVAARAFRELGLAPQKITAVSMPCFGTTSRTKNNAQMLAEQLQVSFREIEITKSVEQHFADIHQDPSQQDVTYENAQARERTQVLMDLANQVNGIVIGTGDLSELALGWATYNGDHMSMYGVNAGIPKTLVRQLVQHLAKQAPEPLDGILKDILETPVSPELLPPLDGGISQKTEELVGPYQLHDFFLFYLLRYQYPPQKILFLAKTAFRGQWDDAAITHWLQVCLRRFFSQQFKRSCLPDGPQVGTVGLSPRGGWMMPSDISPKLWTDFA